MERTRFLCLKHLIYCSTTRFQTVLPETRVNQNGQQASFHPLTCVRNVDLAFLERIFCSKPRKTFIFASTYLHRRRKMLKVLLVSVVIVAIAVVLLSVRLLCGKDHFVSSHVDDNEALRKRGITCFKEQDQSLRQHEGLRIREHS